MKSMLPDGTLESWDMQFAHHFRFQEEQGPVGTQYPGSAKQKRERGADLLQAMQYVAETLQDNQGYRIPVRGNAFRAQFPFASYLDVGDLFDNLDNGLVYKVTGVFKGPDGKKSEVTLEGQEAPASWHRLRPRNRIQFNHSYPKALAKPYDFDDQSNLVKESGPFTDTITWQTVRKEPGTLGKRPFDDPKEVKKRNREYIQLEETNCDYAMQVTGQQFDGIVQFDIWAQTNERAEFLLDWFYDYMERYTWVFRWNGVKDVQFWQQRADALVTRWRNDIVVRSVQFYFQTERIRSFPVRRITEIDLAVDVLVDNEHLQLPASVVDPTACVDPSGIIPIEIIDGPGEFF